MTASAETLPPMTPAASGWYSAPPLPMPKTSGSTPVIVVSEVIAMARRRWCPPMITASSMPCPSSRNRRMASSFTTASLSAMPIITTMPMSDTALMLWPVIQRKTSPPAAAIGTVSITTSGTVNDANSPASTRNISAAERMPTSVSSFVVRRCSASAPLTVHDVPAGSLSDDIALKTSSDARLVPPDWISPSTAMTGRCPSRTTSTGALVSLMFTSCDTGTPFTTALSASARSSLAAPA